MPSHSKLASKTSEWRGDVRSTWTTKCLRKSCDMVLNKGKSVRLASKKYGVPRNTIADYLKRIKKGESCLANVEKLIPGTEPVLTTAEEEALAQELTECQLWGFPLSLRRCATAVKSTVLQSDTPERVKRFGDDAMPQYAWWQGFRRRHPEFGIAEPENIDSLRTAITRDILDTMYDTLQAMLTSCRHPFPKTHIWQYDEKPVVIQGGKEKVILNREEEAALQQEVDPDRSHVTLLPLVNAAGQRGPFTLIFPGAGQHKKNYELVAGTPFFHCMTEKGFSTNESKLDFLTTVFIPHAKAGPGKAPHLIILDGHCSNVNLEFLRECKRNNVLVYVLPPHSSHLTQPLDLTCNGPCSKYYTSAVRDWRAAHPSSEVSKYNVATILHKHKVVEQAFSPHNIIKGFAKAGLVPFNRAAIADSQLRQRQQAAEPELTLLPETPPTPTTTRKRMRRTDMEIVRDENDDLKRQLAEMRTALEATTTRESVLRASGACRQRDKEQHERDKKRRRDGAINVVGHANADACMEALERRDAEKAAKAEEQKCKKEEAVVRRQEQQAIAEKEKALRAQHGNLCKKCRLPQKWHTSKDACPQGPPLTLDVEAIVVAAVESQGDAAAAPEAAAP
jgi:hypothetical protein